MTTNIRSRTRQAGSMVIEAMVSILLFSIGILALIGTATTATTNVGEAKYRVDASLLAEQLIGQMWASNRTQTALQAQFGSPSGAAYLTWAQSSVAAALPGVAPNLMPTVSVSAVAPAVATMPPAPNSSYVTITIQWQAPADKAPHRYVAVTQIPPT